MIIKNAEFITSAADPDNFLNAPYEIAVAGRSNVGKSSFINFLTNNGKLARTSSTPGHTRTINYFKINNGEFHIVDLPGYGYAKVSHDEKKKWGILIDNYLLNSKGLINVFVILDIRRDPTPEDKQLIMFLTHHSIPFTIIATKSDKIPKSAINLRKRIIAAELKMGEGNIFEVSSLKKTGLDNILERIAQLTANKD